MPNSSPAATTQPATAAVRPALTCPRTCTTRQVSTPPPTTTVCVQASRVARFVMSENGQPRQTTRHRTCQAPIATSTPPRPVTRDDVRSGWRVDTREAAVDREREGPGNQYCQQAGGDPGQPPQRP